MPFLAGFLGATLQGLHGPNHGLVLARAFRNRAAENANMSGAQLFRDAQPLANSFNLRGLKLRCRLGHAGANANRVQRYARPVRLALQCEQRFVIGVGQPIGGEIDAVSSEVRRHADHVRVGH